MMEKEFDMLSKKAPKDLVQEKTLPDGTKVKRWGPFVYGYSVTVGPDGKPEVKE
ncbi:MAG: Hsp20/alpha crystallin family protein, partial [Candidatus Korarchaeota archaeon]|nr:Hsp20/alpha crystallin family protein [Candidatus Korarchaeota archaeon]